MVKLQSNRRGGAAVDYRKCTAVAAVLTALIVFGVELAGGPAAPAPATLTLSAPTVIGAALPGASSVKPD